MNAGMNRLLRNNGDGSFTDVTVNVGLDSDNAWGTSGVIADIDGDGLCDLVAANYCDLEQPVDQPCFESDGTTEVSCHPLRFRADGDRFWKGTPEGRFVDVTDDWCADHSPGRGLGLLVGKLDG